MSMFPWHLSFGCGYFHRQQIDSGKTRQWNFRTCWAYLSQNLSWFFWCSYHEWLPHICRAGDYVILATVLCQLLCYTRRLWCVGQYVALVTEVLQRLFPVGCYDVSVTIYVWVLSSLRNTWRWCLLPTSVLRKWEISLQDMLKSAVKEIRCRTAGHELNGLKT